MSVGGEREGRGRVACRMVSRGVGGLGVRLMVVRGQERNGVSGELERKERRERSGDKGAERKERGQTDATDLESSSGRVRTGLRYTVSQRAKR